METLQQYDQLLAAVVGGALVWLLNQKTERDRRKVQEASRFDQIRRELFGEFAGWARLHGGRVAALLDSGTVEESVATRDELLQALFRAGKLEAEIDLVSTRDDVRQAARAVMAAAATVTFDSLPLKWEIGLDRVAPELPRQVQEWQAKLDVAVAAFLKAARGELRIVSSGRTTGWGAWRPFRRVRR